MKKLFVLILGVCLSLMAYASHTVTYTISSTSAVTVSGDTCSGAKATYSSTYTSKNQLTKTNSMTLKVKGMDGCRIIGLKLSMRSNASAGSGYLNAFCGAGTIATIGSSSQGVTFANAKWNGSYTTSWSTVTVALSDSVTIGTGDSLTIIIGATVNSLYVANYQITYLAPGESLDAPIAVTGVSLSEAGTYLDLGATYQLEPVITPSNAANQNVTYTSSNPTVASVSASGLITALNPGNAMMTVTTVDGNKTTNFAVVVNELSGIIYHKVTSADSLAAGDKFIILNETARKAAGPLANSKYMEGTAAVVWNGKATSANATEIVLGGTSGAWTLTTASGTKIGCTGSSNDLSFGSSASNTVWTISIDAATGNATIQNTTAVSSTSGANYLLAYNGGGVGRVSAYLPSSNQSPVYIYKRNIGDNPVLTAADSLVFAQKALAADGTATDSKTLAVKAEELGTDSITAVLKNGTVFAVSPAKLTSKGGNLTISYNATAVGTYLDTLVLTGKTVAGADITAQVALKAVVVAAGGITPSGTNVTYNLLQNLSDLHSGDKVFFSTVKSDVNSVMGLYDYNVASANIRLQNATYDAQRHQVTALDTYAYTVQVTNNGYQFVGSDGKFLYMYNENKNLSSTDTDIASNKAEWTISITDDVATIKNCSNQQWLMQYNISGLFCCYQGANTSTKDIVLYASQAPAYQQKVLHPAITVSDDSIVFTSPAYDDIDKVYYDSYSLTVTGTDLTASIVPTVTGDTVFKAYTTLNAAGGSLTVYFESPVAGTFNGVLTLTSDTVVRTVRLKAVVSGSAADPTPHFTVADTVFISANLSDFSTDQSVTVPVVGNNFATMIYYAVPDSVNTFTDAYFELDDTDLGRMDRTGGNITVYYYADAAGVYDGRLSMYCYGTKGDESTKVTKNVVLHLVVTNGNANALTDEDAAVKADKMLQNGHIYILRDGVLYDTTGRMIR